MENKDIKRQVTTRKSQPSSLALIAAVTSSKYDELLDKVTVGNQSVIGVNVSVDVVLADGTVTSARVGRYNDGEQVVSYKEYHTDNVFDPSSGQSVGDVMRNHFNKVTASPTFGMIKDLEVTKEEGK